LANYFSFLAKNCPDSHFLKVLCPHPNQSSFFIFLRFQLVAAKSNSSFTDGTAFVSYMGSEEQDVWPNNKKWKANANRLVGREPGQLHRVRRGSRSSQK
jgi:hypothetical protein